MGDVKHAMTGVWVPCWVWQRRRWRVASEESGELFEEWAARVLDAEISRMVVEPKKGGEL